MPESGDFPPFLTFAAVLAIAPVAGMPPKKPTNILLAPSAISSVLELCLSFIILSETTQDSKDSIPASNAIVNALGNKESILSPVMVGRVKVGNCEEIVYSEPIVFVLIIGIRQTNEPNKTAIKEPGIFLEIFGQTIKTISPKTPIANAQGLKNTFFIA